MPIEKAVRVAWVKRETILDRRIWVYYLIIVEAALERFKEQLEVRPDERFFKVLDEHVRAYVERGKMPPDAIASAVLNAADDVLAGRDVTLKAGDYIAVQNYLRGQTSR